MKKSNEWEYCGTRLATPAGRVPYPGAYVFAVKYLSLRGRPGTREADAADLSIKTVTFFANQFDLPRVAFRAFRNFQPSEKKMTN